MSTSSARNTRSAYIKRPVPATPPLSARVGRAASRAAAIAGSVAGFVGMRTIGSKEYANDRFAMIAWSFGIVFVLALLAQVFGAKPVEGSRSGNLEVNRGFAIVVIGGFLAMIGWITVIAL